MKDASELVFELAIIVAGVGGVWIDDCPCRPVGVNEEVEEEEEDAALLFPMGDTLDREDLIVLSDK